MTKRRQAQRFVDKGLEVKVSLRNNGRTKYLYIDSLDKLKRMFEGFKIVNAWSKNNNHYLLLR